MNILLIYFSILCFISVVFILINFEKSYAINKVSIQLSQVESNTENLETTPTSIQSSNMTNIENEEAELLPNLLLNVDDKDNLFKTKLIQNLTNNGFNLIKNESKKYGNSDYLLIELNDTNTMLKLKDYLDKFNPNITSSVLRVFEPF